MLLERMSKKLPDLIAILPSFHKFSVTNSEGISSTVNTKVGSLH
jgi:hypothetical protein